MKITFLGNFKADFSSESHYLKTLRKLGHEVYPLQEGVDKVEVILEKAVKYSDMFFWVHTHNWATEGMAEALEIMKEKGIPTVGYHLDLWLGIEREKDLETDPYWNIEHFFTVDKVMADMMNGRKDLPKAYYLPAGVYEDECYMAEFNPQYAHDVVFVGSRRYHPEWQYRPTLVNWLSQVYGKRFAHYGGDGRGVIRGDKLNQLYRSSKIVIGDTLCKDFSYPYYLSDRIFETTGRGGFIIHPWIEGIKKLYRTQEPIATPDSGYHGTIMNTFEAEIISYPFGNFAYLKYLIDYYIENNEEREAIRLKGHQRTKKDHTYTNRLKYILEKIK